MLVTHDHSDHNGVGAIGGDPLVVRRAGRTSDADRVVTGIASEHDGAAGTERGANVIFLIEFESVLICHFGDFGQAELRPEQERAIGRPDVLFLPVGGGAPTIDGKHAAEIAKRLAPSFVVPMHYRTDCSTGTTSRRPSRSSPSSTRDRRAPHDERVRRPAAPAGEGTTVLVPALP